MIIKLLQKFINFSNKASNKLFCVILKCVTIMYNDSMGHMVVHDVYTNDINHWHSKDYFKIV